MADATTAGAIADEEKEPDDAYPDQVVVNLVNVLDHGLGLISARVSLQSLEEARLIDGVGNAEGREAGDQEHEDDGAKRFLGLFLRCFEAVDLIRMFDHLVGDECKLTVGAGGWLDLAEANL